MALQRTFSDLGYTIIVRENLTDIEIVKEIEGVVSRSCKSDSLIVCILSHGSEGEFLFFGILKDLKFHFVWTVLIRVVFRLVFHH